jgi:hypothetical protein
MSIEQTRCRDEAHRVLRHVQSVSHHKISH